jgi:hypothetical protein
MVLLGGANGMYLFAATDMRWPSTTGDYLIQQLAIPVGCSAPRTMVWTPQGTMWLGNDRQVYMLPFGSVTPVPIGNKILSVLNSGLLNLQGLESLPPSQIQNACATYDSFHGYYILSFAGAGSSVNNIQYWLDITRLNQDADGNWGPWYGPMTGQTLSCFFTENGQGDSGQVLAGEGTAYGNVYQISADGVYGDVVPSSGAVQTIPVYWLTSYNPLKDPLRCDIHKMEAQLLATSGTIQVNLYDMNQSLVMGNQFNMSSSATLWNQYYWGQTYWANSAPTRQVIDISPAVQPRRLALGFSQNVSNDKFELYEVTAEAVEQAQPFA